MIALKHIVYVWKGRCFCGEWGGFIDGLLLQADPKVISTNLETPSLKFQGWVILSTKQRDIYPFLKLLVPNCTWKWMVARRSFPFGMASWQVRTVSFRECKSWGRWCWALFAGGFNRVGHGRDGSLLAPESKSIQEPEICGCKHRNHCKWPMCIRNLSWISYEKLDSIPCKCHVFATNILEFI